MRSIAFLQLVSFASRIAAMLMGIIQSLVIVNLLTTSEYGLIGLVTSIAGIVGIAQHLGLASSSTKEISSAKNDTEILHIAMTSISIRYLISLPIALGLIFSAPTLGNLYSNQDLVLPLQLFGGILLIQAFQSIFNSVIAGTQRFKLLFSYQFLITFLSLAIFIPLVFFYKSLGYFYALLVFNFVQTLILGYLAFKNLTFKFSFPDKKDFVRIFKDLLSLSLVIYVVKILVTGWQELPVLILSRDLSLEMIGLFTFAFNFSSKLMTISDSITDVNLPVFSKLAHENLSEFFSSFVKNFQNVYLLILIVGVSISLWSREILLSVDLLTQFVSFSLGKSFESSIYEKYQDSLPLFYPLLLAIISYSYLNIFKSSIFIPLKILKKMISVFSILLIASFGIYFLFMERSIFGMSYAIALGSSSAFVVSIYLIYQKYRVILLNKLVVVFSFCALLIGYLSYYDLNLFSKILVFSIFIFTWYVSFGHDLGNLVLRKIKK